MNRKRYSETIWEQAKQDYCSGNLTLRDAAEKHRINFKAVESRARREGWKRALNENLQIMKDVAAKSLQARSVELGQQSAEFLTQITDQLKILLDDFKARHGQAATLADFERYVATFVQLVRAGRELYGLDSDNQQRPKSLVQIQCVGEVTVAEPCGPGIRPLPQMPDLSKLLPSP